MGRKQRHWEKQVLPRDTEWESLTELRSHLQPSLFPLPVGPRCAKRVNQGPQKPCTPPPNRTVLCPKDLIHGNGRCPVLCYLFMKMFSVIYLWRWSVLSYLFLKKYNGALFISEVQYWWFTSEDVQCCIIYREKTGNKLSMPKRRVQYVVFH